MQRWQASKAHLPFLTLQIQENKPKEKKQLKEEKKKKKIIFMYGRYLPENCCVISLC